MRDAQRRRSHQQNLPLSLGGWTGFGFAARGGSRVCAAGGREGLEGGARLARGRRGRPGDVLGVFVSVFARVQVEDAQDAAVFLGGRTYEFTVCGWRGGGGRLRVLFMVTLQAIVSRRGKDVTLSLLLLGRTIVSGGSLLGGPTLSRGLWLGDLLWRVGYLSRKDIPYSVVFFVLGSCEETSAAGTRCVQVRKVRTNGWVALDLFATGSAAAVGKREGLLPCFQFPAEDVRSLDQTLIRRVEGHDRNGILLQMLELV